MNTNYDKSYLVHYGVKGMKWGVRHDPIGSGVGRGSSSMQSPKGNKRRKNRLKLSKGTKVALAVTGIAAGTGAALILAQYGRMHADSIMRAGTTLQTLHHHPELVTEGKKFYTTNNWLDKFKYKASFSKNHLGTKKKITATIDKNIKIAGGDTGKKTMLELMRRDPDFKKYVMDNYRANNIDYTYFKFNRNGLLGEGDAQTQKFIDALRKKGYGGVADLNDRRGWRTHANILFDNKNLRDIKVQDLPESEIRKAKKVVNHHDYARAYINEYNAIYVATGGAIVSTELLAEDISKSKKRKKRRY